MNNKEEQEWMNLSTDEKEEKSLELIKSLFNQFDKPVVACSWGKDSLTVLHMVYRVAKELGRGFDVLWNNTLVCYPSVYKLKKRLEKEWDLNIIEARPSMTFWEIVDKYGFPGVNSSDRSDKANQACCYNIKKKPTKQAIKENDWDLYFDGITAYESDRRWMNMRDYGVTHHHKTFGLQKAHPVGYWGVDNIWNYLHKYNIPYPNVYDKEVEAYTKDGYTEQRQGHRVDRSIRCGCWCCTLVLGVDEGKMKQLRVHYPKLWKALMDKGLAKEIARIKLGGQGSLFDGYFTEDTKDNFLERRPCFFDKL